MKRSFATLLCGILVLGLTSCGYSGFYRYPCQDPENWKNAECNPPICEASQTCTKDVIITTPTTPEQEITNG